MCLWLLRCCFGPSCCECCDKDDWTIDSECRPGERGAGYLYKRGKGAAVWSKRFFVLTNEKFTYYTDSDRTNAKGEIILTGATARLNSTRPDEKKKFHFVVSHPVCGVRELYASSNRRRNMWISRINDIAAVVSNVGYFGKILKQGGLMKDTWQERWCHCIGRNLDYFENASDNQVKGSLDLFQAKIREFSLKDQKYGFEVVAANPGKKGMKKYIFAAESESDRKKWVEVMNAASAGTNVVVFSTPNAPQGNPMNENRSSSTAAEDDEEMERGSFSNGKSRAPSIAKPADKFGYLKKKSPALLKGWQNRFFILKEPGEIFYYGNEEEYKSNMQPKGDIQVGEILANGGVTVTGKEININLKERSFQLQAASESEANEWKLSIEAWVAYLNCEV